MTWKGGQMLFQNALNSFIYLVTVAASNIKSARFKLFTVMSYALALCHCKEISNFKNPPKYAKATFVNTVLKRYTLLALVLSLVVTTNCVHNHWSSNLRAICKDEVVLPQVPKPGTKAKVSTLMVSRGFGSSFPYRLI